MVGTLPSSARGAGSIPGQEAKLLHASEPKTQNIKKKKKSNIIANLIKTFKMALIKKTFKNFFLREYLVDLDMAKVVGLVAGEGDSKYLNLISTDAFKGK